MKPVRPFLRAAGSRIRRQSGQSGSALLEALFGILIFSMGILALVGLQTVSMKQVAAGKYRTDASLLANRLVGQMRVGDRRAADMLANYNSPDGAEYVTWLADVQASLPGAVANPPTVVITDVVGSSSLNTHRRATVTMRWKAPNEPATEPAHTFMLVAHVK